MFPCDCLKVCPVYRRNEKKNLYYWHMTYIWHNLSVALFRIGLQTKSISSLGAIILTKTMFVDYSAAWENVGYMFMKVWCIGNICM